MAEKDAKPPEKGELSPSPTATPPAAVPPGATLVAVTAGVPHVPPPAPETPPGGKFGVRATEFRDGRYTETVRYVNAHGLPFSDDPDENLKEKASERRDLRDRK